MRARNSRLSWIVSTLIVASLVGAAGCSGSSSYSEETRTNYLAACLAMGGTDTSCNCTLEYIEGEKSEAEFVRIDAELEFEGSIDAVVYDALDACGIDGSSEGQVTGQTAFSVEEEARGDRLLDEAQQTVVDASEFFTDLSDDILVGGSTITSFDAIHLEQQSLMLGRIADELLQIETGDSSVDEAFYTAAAGVADISWGLALASGAIEITNVAQFDRANDYIIAGATQFAEGLLLRTGVEITIPATTTTQATTTTRPTTTTTLLPVSEPVLSGEGYWASVPVAGGPRLHWAFVLENTSDDHSLTDVVIKYDVLDGEGDVLETRSEFHELWLPGTQLVSTDSAEATASLLDFDNFDISYDPVYVGEDTIEAVEVTGLSFSYRAADEHPDYPLEGWSFTGYLRSSLSKAIEESFAVVVMRDELGEIAGVGTASIRNLQPGSYSPFQIVTGDKVDFTSYKIIWQT